VIKILIEEEITTAEQKKRDISIKKFADLSNPKKINTFPRNPSLKRISELIIEARKG
tara:strand:- start:496 stop:666 length:171 start_codon:yes stop_codon:yes gene_type:complete